jgi:protein phosphatase
MIKLSASSQSQIGAKHLKNDDAIYSNEKEGIFIICDGVSEGGQGQFASNFVVNSIPKRLIEANQKFKNSPDSASDPDRLHEMHRILQQTFAETQTGLSKLTDADSNFKTAATTCVVLWFYKRFAILGHVGDSRAYLNRSGKLHRLTHDHVGYDELIKLGMSEEAAQKNPMSRALTRAIGSAQINQPDFIKIEFQPNDVAFLCTDGFYTGLERTGKTSEFAKELAEKEPISHWIENCAKLTGDDSSLVSIHFQEQDQRDLETTLVDIKAADRINLIQKAPLSKHLNYLQQVHIAAICEIERFKKGETVITDGDEGTWMYVVASGQLSVLKDKKVIREINPGEFFGEIALIQNSKRTATVIAKEETVLLSLTRKDLEEVFTKDPSIESRFYKAMLEKVLDRTVELTQQLSDSQGTNSR